LTSDAFVLFLGGVPDENWCRTWVVDRTIILRRISKRVKEVVDKMRLPVVVRFSRSFWDDARNVTATEKIPFVLRQILTLTVTVTVQCRITTLELPHCEMKGQDTERLAGVLTQ
jgi:hypothetical protein